MEKDRVNILLVDDQPAKLLTFRTILAELDENLITANSAREALEILLKTDVALILIDVYMPETDGFELAALIRDHPRFGQTPIIFISAVLLSDIDRLRGYEMGAVDYVSVPVIPAVLRAKVSVFLDLFRKTRALRQLNSHLEARVAARTAALAASERKLRDAEKLRSLALAAGAMGAWEWDCDMGVVTLDHGQAQILGLETGTPIRPRRILRLVHADDRAEVVQALRTATQDYASCYAEFRIARPDGEIRWCQGSAAASFHEAGGLARLSGVMVDISESKRSQDRQMLLAQEVDHRARNVVAVVQSILRITRADSIEDYIAAVDGRIGALSHAHKLLANSRWQGADLHRLIREELTPYRGDDLSRVQLEGADVLLSPAMAQTMALVLHELTTNAVKHGALSCDRGKVRISWSKSSDGIRLQWCERDGPRVQMPARQGYGTRIFQTGIERQLNGAMQMNWRAEGLECHITIPVERQSREATDLGAAARRGQGRMPRPAPANHSVLIVEDEPTIALMLSDLIREMGHSIAGPFNCLDDALAAIEDARPIAGVLDINVAGQPVYALAQVLTRHRIPFVFVTGYERDTIDAQFAAAPVLQKPIRAEALTAVLQTLTRRPSALAHPLD